MLPSPSWSSLILFDRPGKKSCNSQISQREESPVVVVDVDVGRGVDVEHDPRLQAGVKVAKSGHWFISKVHLVMYYLSILEKRVLHDQTSALFCLQINLLDKMSKKIPHCELVPVKTRGQSVKCSTLTKNEPVHCTVGKFQSVWYYQLSRIAFLHCERSIQWTKLQTPKHYQKGLATPNPEKGANKPQTQKRGQPTPQLQKGGKEPHNP